MELRHLRYFIAVAEAGSFKLAAETRLHTAQPSLSRQIRNLEDEVGAQLLRRSARGVELTAAGQSFLDHARQSVAQAEAAAGAARRAATPARQVFAVGFVTGHELDCIPPTTVLLLEDLPNLEIRVFSGFSTKLADDLQRGKLDAAFLRREPNPQLDYRLVISEPLVAILPSHHRLAGHGSIEPRDLVDENFIGVSPVAPILRNTVNGYLKQSGVAMTPHLEIDNFAMAISLVGATQGVALLPASIESYLPPSIVSRPLRGESPVIDLVLGFHMANQSPVLARFLSRLAELSIQLRAARRT
ncbi:LysR substrate-binding domain-containing protein [Acidisphaera sp. L21]|uniref:LysR substrate-binding domain-containing protein n=1 Tax=Acidisphaera sp. L21 TaxID=1641851 RepID=UPI00131BAAC8|nr:LysR substrate-binding domain-containing protein [Acidisphaera sp. L21]